MDAKQVRNQLEVVRDRLNAAVFAPETDAQIGAILIAVSLLTDIVETIVKEHTDEHTSIHPRRR